MQILAALHIFVHLEHIGSIRAEVLLLSQCFELRVFLISILHLVCHLYIVGFQSW